jgi:hypothetical protein
MSSSVGMMTFPTEWKNKNVPTHQPDDEFIAELVCHWIWTRNKKDGLLRKQNWTYVDETSEHEKLTWSNMKKRWMWWNQAKSMVLSSKHYI